jgi:ATP synthase protein I
LTVSLACPPLPDPDTADQTLSLVSVEGEQTDGAASALPLPVVAPKAPATADDRASADPSNGMDSFYRLQRRLLLATLLLSAVAVAVTALVGSLATALSLLVGALAGLLYLWLLSRSVTRLGENSRRMSKAQLLVPVALVLVSAKVPQLSILPALLGFLLYKPAVILQAVFDS